ncbi:MAG: M14 family zinc carboxypeptidase, partial [Actinomycetes bacterium]
DLTSYLRTVADRSEVATYEEIGTTTMGNDFPVLTISSPENLANLDRIRAINQRLSDPRGLSPARAERLAAEGKPVYLLEGSIHSTEVGTAQVMPGIVHRLATESSTTVQEILDDSVLVVIPSQNPDGQKLVVDYFHQTAGTDQARVYPDLYHKYVGHDDNRDWFMLTQPESQLSVELQNEIKPAVVHNLHQMGANGPRIFNPPYLAPSDPNIHPITVQQTNSLGMEMGRQLTAEGKKGAVWADNYDYWTPSRQYMTYHGAPRLLTEVASVDDLAYDHTSADGTPLGPQEPDTNFIEPYDQSTWSLEQIVDYLDTAVFGGLSNVAKYHEEWLLTLYRTQRDAVSPAGKPFAFVVPADQEDPYATYDMLTVLDRGDVE